MRSVLLAALVVLALPGALAAVTGFEGDAALEAGSRSAWPLDAGEGDALLLEWESDVEVDLFVVQGEDASALDDASATPRLAAAVLDRASGRAHVTLPAPGPW